ncbi:hypothetical protein CTI12_AA357280 [Artemisia annua]|uniref:Uncharacterized protein n=1 Tax=Artemisia annua TaxID=35608 RepID=A0A2U1MPF5_ARTAN|nr:hypothetical protein CTI12_AA357280 [Artemisia annua]
MRSSLFIQTLFLLLLCISHDHYMTQASRVLKLDQLATKDFMSNEPASSHFSPIEEGEFIPLPPLVHDQPASPPYTIWPPPKSGQGVMSHDDKVNEPASSQEGGFIPLPP